MKRFCYLAAFAALTATISVACTKDDTPSQKEIETHIIGKWKRVKSDGIETLTNGRVIETYESNGQGTISLSYYSTSILNWQNQGKMSYSVSGNQLEIRGIDKSFYTISSIDENKCIKIVDKIINAGGTEFDRNIPMEFAKVKADFSKDIIGLWEGVAMTGYETYGNTDARIEYKADGSYVYYTKEDDGWAVSKNADNEYNVDGDWLATRWRPEPGRDYNYEWWDIDEIKDGTMKWSALRKKEDGSLFNTTFTWKKVKN